ncbi:MAG: hypothetical protein QM736_18370 [Vicinamibacterales bacterium]
MVPYFDEAFGPGGITKERVARAIAAYEMTRMSGNSPVDRWRLNRDERAVSEQVKQGYDLFFGKAACNQCHLGNNYTDSSFHNIGVGYDPKTRRFADEGRSAISKDPAHLGAFKTPTLRDVAKHAPSHARRIGRDTRGSGRVVQPRRRAESESQSEDQEARAHAS